MFQAHHIRTTEADLHPSLTVFPFMLGLLIWHFNAKLEISSDWESCSIFFGTECLLRRAFINLYFKLCFSETSFVIRPEILCYEYGVYVWDVLSSLETPTLISMYLMIVEEERV
jgi:hypothetical protein